MMMTTFLFSLSSFFLTQAATVDCSWNKTEDDRFELKAGATQTFLKVDGPDAKVLKCEKAPEGTSLWTVILDRGVVGTSSPSRQVDLVVLNDKDLKEIAREEIAFTRDPAKPMKLPSPSYLWLKDKKGKWHLQLARSKKEVPLPSLK